MSLKGSDAVGSVIGSQHLLVLCNHCMRTERMIIYFVLYVMQEPQGEQ